MLSAGPYGFVAQHRCNLRHTIANQAHVKSVTNARDRLREARRWLPFRAARDLDASLPCMADVFIHGVVSGDPLADAIVLWTHVTTDDAVVLVDWVLAGDSVLGGVVAWSRTWTRATTTRSMSTSPASSRPPRTGTASTRSVNAHRSGVRATRQLRRAHPLRHVLVRRKVQRGLQRVRPHRSGSAASSGASSPTSASAPTTRTSASRSSRAASPLALIPDLRSSAAGPVSPSARLPRAR